MTVQVKPSYAHYSCEFIAHVSQGSSTPLTLRIERPRDSADYATLYISVGEVQVCKARLDLNADATMLSELFTRARLYEFPPKKDD